MKMNKTLLIYILLFASYIHTATAQCIATISPAHSCTVPLTLKITPNFPMDSIYWYWNGALIHTDTVFWNTNGITVAGGHSSGNATNQLYYPQSVFVDNNGTIYVADMYNHRIQKWPSGAKSGSTIAGTGTAGSGNNEFNMPAGIFVDGSDAMYIADKNNNRVQKWAAGATSGITVAGGNGAGNAANQLNGPTGIFVDGNGTIFIADANNNRVQKWLSGATSGTTVLGTGVAGNAVNQLNSPTAVFVDSKLNTYIVDKNNNRVQVLLTSARAAKTAAGGNGAGSAANQLNAPCGIYVNGNMDMFIADAGNNRIVKWQLGYTQGITVAGGNGAGSAANQLNAPGSVFGDKNGNLYVADSNNHRVQEFMHSIVDTLVVTHGGTYDVIVKSFTGCSDTVTSVIDSITTAIITASGSLSFCEGDSVSLTVSPSTGFTYKWQANSTDISGATDTLYTAHTSGNYTAIISNGTCTNTSAAVVVVANPLPQPTIAANGASLSTGTFATYQWYLNGNIISGATNSTLTATQDGDYTVEVTDGNGCKGMSSVKHISLGINSITGNNQAINIYPNPATSTIQVNAPREVNVSIRTIDGKQVVHQYINNLEAIDISRLVNGMYIIRVSDKNNNLLKVEKLVKTHTE